MIPRFLGKHVSLGDLNLESDVERTAYSLQGVEQYALEVERVNCFSSTHWDIAMPTLKLHPDDERVTAACRGTIVSFEAELTAARLRKRCVELPCTLLAVDFCA